ncbi:hypothetical protein GN156_18455, partial [bacterium LRH843]|nr:hypothetical protein [bacterium LRH843]
GDFNNGGGDSSNSNGGVIGSDSDFDGGASQCTCVPYFLCDNGTIVTDGANIIDIREKPEQCVDSLQVCCKAPLDKSEISFMLCKNSTIFDLWAGSTREKRRERAQAAFCSATGRSSNSRPE